MQVPADPKLLVTPLQPEKLAQFELTSLEKSSKRALVLEADLGIPINLLDIERYAVPQQAPELAPEDQALLEVNMARLLCCEAHSTTWVECFRVPHCSCAGGRNKT